MQQMHAYSKKYDDIFGKHDDMFALCSKYKHPPENIMIFFEKYHDIFWDMRNFAAYITNIIVFFKNILIFLLYAAKLRRSQKIS